LEKEANSSEPRRTIFLTYLVTTIAFLLWLGGLVLAPYLRSQASPWAGLVYSFYSPVCHQAADRSLLCFGQPLAVCARCTGIYLGFWLGLAFYPILRGWRRLSLPSARAFLIVSAPIVLDTAANFLKLWRTPTAVRLATGVLWGTILPFYFVPGMADLFLSRRKKRLEIRRDFPLE
jgi:uncharacterized membrane protein